MRQTIYATKSESIKNFYPPEKNSPVIWRRFCKWAIGKLSKYIETSKMEIKQYNINTENILKGVRESLVEVIKRGYKPKAVFMGPEDFNKYCSEKPEDPLAFNIDFLDIYVFPWMKGVLVVPDFEGKNSSIFRR